MTFSAEERQLADLLFEVSGTREPKLLLAVCDDGAKRRKLNRELRVALKERGKLVSVLQAGALKSDLLARFYAESSTGTVDAMILGGLERLGLSALESLFRELNFHRDALTALGVPLVIWLTTENLRSLAAVAPDFWSRRTAVYYFAGISPRDLLKRLFAKGDASARGGTRSVIARALGGLLESERSLSRCMRRKSVSVRDADDCLGHLHSGLSELRNHIREKRQIEIALWLWNIAGLDRDLQAMIERVSQKDRRIFEAVYVDRNEALLYTAEQISSILDDYGKQIDETVTKRKAPALVGIFRRSAITKLNAIAADLDSYIGVSTTDLEHWLVDDYEYPEEDPSDSLEKTFGAQASYELESWLSGYNDERPPFFSADEGKLLKALYSSEFPLDEICSRFGMKRGAARAEVKRLQEKVQLFLSTSEKRWLPEVSRR